GGAGSTGAGSGAKSVQTHTTSVLACHSAATAAIIIRWRQTENAKGPNICRVE
ncbi:MAG: hypothetical protein ACD_55C00156G0001, partial [uncultured bacterium]